MKTLKAFAIGLITLLAANAAKAQVSVGVHIGTPPPPARVVVVERPVPVYHRTVVVHQPVSRHVVVHRPYGYRRTVVRKHYVKQQYRHHAVGHHRHH